MKIVSVEFNKCIICFINVVIPSGLLYCTSELYWQMLLYCVYLQLIQMRLSEIIIL